MICPNCGAETTGDVCITCGTRVGGASNFSLNGEAGASVEPQPAGDNFSDLDSQPYSMGTENGYPSYNTASPKKSKTGLIVGIIAVIAVIAVLLIVFVFGENGAKKSEELIKTYMAGLQEADADKIASTVDPECVEASDMEDLADTFSLLSSMGVEYTVDYEILSTEKASSSEIKSMCAGLYGDAGLSSEVKKAYICEVEMTIEVSYFGESESETETQNLICYKKDGNWYIGGTME